MFWFSSPKKVGLISRVREETINPLAIGKCFIGTLFLYN